MFLHLHSRALAPALVSVAAGEISRLERMVLVEVVKDLLTTGYQDGPRDQDSSEDAPHARDVLQG